VSDSAGGDQRFLAADSDRYINVYSMSQKKLVHTLVASNSVTAIDLSSSSQDAPEVLRQQILCATTKDGTAELFAAPFATLQALNGDLKSNRKNLTRKAAARIRLISSGAKSKPLPVIAASLQGPDLVLASADNGIDLAFEKVRWQDEGNGELLFVGEKQVVRAKNPSTLNTATLNGVKDTSKTRVDESKTVVVQGGAAAPSVADAIEISSSESDAEDEDEDSADEASAQEESNQRDGSDSEVSASDDEMADAEPENSEPAGESNEPADVEPSFGDLLAARHPTEVSIASAFPDSTTALSIPREGAFSSALSLSTVLTQALRTNDTPLLETCLHTSDTEIVTATIQRLDSSLAGLLLSKLAERLASRPGRYGHLIAWVQTTCVAHGGALASQPDVTSKIRTLYQVLNDKMRTHQDLLLLKGKLDLLDAQLRFRRQVAAQRGTASREGRDQPGFIYLEGSRGNWDSDEDLDEDGTRPSKRAKGVRKALDAMLEDSDDEDESDQDGGLPLVNGDHISSSDEDEDEDEDEEGSEDERAGIRVGVIDDEASVSDAEDSDPDDVGPSPVASDESSAVSSDDDDSEEEVEEDEEDSEMDSFINDGSVDFEEEAADEIRVEGDSSDDDQEDDQEDADAQLDSARLQRSRQKAPTIEMDSPARVTKTKERTKVAKATPEKKKVKAKKSKH
jgi:U3 small nucleolar RNA-associated protein 5